jgi:hypothetical protein
MQKWELKGVPVRIAPKDLENGTLRLQEIH